MAGALSRPKLAKLCLSDCEGGGGLLMRRALGRWLHPGLTLPVGWYLASPPLHLYYIIDSLNTCVDQAWPHLGTNTHTPL